MLRGVVSFAQRASWSLGLVLVLASAAAAQSPTGILSGRVTDVTGTPRANVIVTVASPSLLQNQRTSTSENGDYLFRLLPPGEYQVSFALAGFAEATETRDIAATQPMVVNVVLRPGPVREAVTVKPEASLFFNTVTSATNFSQSVVDQLPLGRSVPGAVALAPGVHATGPDGALSLGGAMTFENVFLVDGVQSQDNLRGTPLALYIEDAIQETTVQTSGVSAEYGRFTGGLIHTVTRSGSNDFSGSFRTGFTNDQWRSVTPFEESKVDALVPTYEFTAGGPVVANRTWFFGAGRFFDQTTARQTGITNVPFEFNANEKRYEAKVTQSLGEAQRLQVAYTGIDRLESNHASAGASNVMDLASLTDRSLPQRLLSAHYTGMFGDRFFLEGQYSLRRFTFEGDGGRSRDRVLGTFMLDQSTGASWWAPEFCGVCSNERRDNDSLLVKGSYFLSNGAGAHDLVFGYETFNDRTDGNVHQSGSDYHVWTTASIIDNGTIFPVMEGGPDGFSTFIIHWPILQPSRGTNYRSHALFFNDSWKASSRLSLNLGLRFDRNQGRDSSGNLVAHDSAFSPRVGAAFDLAGDGRTVVTASAGRYVAAIANGIASTASPAGRSAILAYFYQGPPINMDPNEPLVPTNVALQQVFDWLDTTAPSPFQATVPGVETQIRESLKSPRADEFAAGVTRQIDANTSVRVDVVHRTFGDFYSERADTTTGQVADEFGQPFDLRLIENTNLLTRRYTALHAQASFRAGQDGQMGGSYTLSRLHGNVDGETAGSGPVPLDVLSYPEYFDLAWRSPKGSLAADQRHRLRLWGIYVMPVGGDSGSLSLGLVQHLESGTPYGAVGSIDTSAYVTDPGYVLPPVAAVPYYFTPRDEFRTEAMFRTDVSVTFNRRVGSARRVALFAQAQVLNVFNQFQVFNRTGGQINTTVRTAVTDPRPTDDPARMQPFNPFTETPVEGVHWERGPLFGQPTAAGAYTLPRDFRFSVGFRF
jgi:hypothetical protein